MQLGGGGGVDSDFWRKRVKALKFELNLETPKPVLSGTDPYFHSENALFVFFGGY